VRVSRFLLLFVFLIWLAWRSQSDVPRLPQPSDLALFFGLYLLMVGVLAAWSRLLARRVRHTRLEHAVRYFNHVVYAARFFVPVWFAIGTFLLGWGEAVQAMLGPVARWPVQFPGAVIGTIPALAAWAGLWWSQYPADQALREQSLLVRLDDNLPIYRPPSLWSYLVQNLRLQIFFTSIPILLILLLHDAVMLFLWRGLGRAVETSSTTDGVVTFLSALAVFVAVPEVLVRILPTHPLPASTLRERMEAMCRAYRLRFRDILLWRTQNRIANALVMGIIPRFRYVLLSDLLLEEMSEEQIEAVFAHELGHVVHRHMIWYLVFLKVLILVLAVIALLLEAEQQHFALPPWLPMDLVMTLIAFGGFLIGFGYVSRRFERQADVFAARTLERNLAPVPTTAEAAAADDAVAGATTPPAAASPSYVGPTGATIFASALRRVAVINNMPLEPRGRWEGGLLRRLSYLFERLGDLTNNWLHGSIPQRMRTLQHMSADPAHTHHFDRRMARLYVNLLLALVVSGALAWMIQVPL
jgi:STE24 endopeptidase